MRSCSRVSSQPFDPDFARLIARKFPPGRLLIVDSEAEQLIAQEREDEVTSTICRGIAGLDALQRLEALRASTSPFGFIPRKSRPLTMS